MHRMGPVQHRTVSDVVAERIRDLIEQGKFRPGDQLPTEMELAHAFDVGRTSVREALKALSAKGMIDRSRRGTFVRRPEPEESMTLAAAVRQANIRDVYDARLILEVALAKKVAERATAEDIVHLKAAAELMESIDPSEADAIFEADMAFHFQLAEMADNPLIQEMLLAVRARVYDVLRAAALSPEVVRRSNENHRRLIEAIENADPDLAAEIMVESLADAETGFLQFIQKDEGTAANS